MNVGHLKLSWAILCSSMSPKAIVHVSEACLGFQVYIVGFLDFFVYMAIYFLDNWNWQLLSP